MKQIIGLVLLIIWFILLIIGLAEPVREYEVSTPKWVGWVYVILFLGLPFISKSLMMNNKPKN